MKRVLVIFRHVDGTWTAESEDAPEWIGVADTFDEAMALTMEGLPFLLDEPVVVVPEVVGQDWPANWGGVTGNTGHEVDYGAVVPVAG